MKVLLFGNGNYIFIKELAKNLVQNNIQVDLISESKIQNNYLKEYSGVNILFEETYNSSLGLQRILKKQKQ